MIDNWFHFYSTTESFEVHRKQGLINPDSICFLKETSQIFTQNTFFGICKERFERLEKLVLEHDVKIKDILGIEGPSVNDGVVNNIADLVNFLDGFTDQDNLKDFLDIMKAVLTQKIDILEEEIRGDLETLHNSVNGINSKFEAVNIRLDNHDTTITALNTSLAAHIREYNLLKNSYNSFKELATTKFESINNSISAINDSIDSLQDYFEGLEEKFEAVEDRIAEVDDLLREARALVQNLEDRFGSTLAELEQFKRDINDEMDDFKALVGAPNGMAPLDRDAKVPAAYLPSYVDDVLEYATKAAFPVTGETGKIYVALDDNLTYRWTGSTYIEISKSLGLGETATTAYPGNKGKANADAIAAHKADTNNPHNVTKTQLGLDKVNNTADEDKPVSNAQAIAIQIVQDGLTSHKEDKTNPHEVTKTQVGLGNVDNTSDADKPISTTTQNALDTKVDKVNGQNLVPDSKVAKYDAHLVDTTNPHGVTKTQVGLDKVDNTADIDKPVSTATQAAIDVVANSVDAHERDYNNPHRVTKVQVGLDKVDNTADLDKPISTATQSAIDIVGNSLATHIADKTNPHNVTKAQVGLGNVDNTSDADKPASAQVQNLLNTKVDKITGKQLSTNDYTNEDKLKVQLASSLLSGTSAERVLLSNISVGQHYFDTDLNADMVWNGTTWLMIVTTDSWNVIR